MGTRVAGPMLGIIPLREILHDSKALETQANKYTDEILSTGYLVGHMSGGKEHAYSHNSICELW